MKSLNFPFIVIIVLLVQSCKIRLIKSTSIQYEDLTKRVVCYQEIFEFKQLDTLNQIRVFETPYLSIYGFPHEIKSTCKRLLYLQKRNYLNSDEAQILKKLSKNPKDILSYKNEAIYNTIVTWFILRSWKTEKMSIYSTENYKNLDYLIVDVCDMEQISEVELDTFISTDEIFIQDSISLLKSTYYYMMR